MNVSTSLTSLMTAGLVASALGCCGPTHPEPEPQEAGVDTSADYRPAPGSNGGRTESDIAEPDIAEVIDRLDVIDGIQDDRYTNLSLHITNTTGVCEVALGVMDAIPPNTAHYRVQMVNMTGETVDVDCDELIKKLTVLLDIAEKNPATGFIAEKHRNGVPSQGFPGAKQLFGYNIVDHMISALLLGVGRTSESFAELFGDVTFSTYSATMRQLGRDLNRPDYMAMDVRNAKEGYVIFEWLGKKYGFDPAPFKP